MNQNNTKNQSPSQQDAKTAETIPQWKINQPSNEHDPEDDGYDDAFYEMFIGPFHLSVEPDYYGDNEEWCGFAEWNGDRRDDDLISITRLSEDKAKRDLLKTFRAKLAYWAAQIDAILANTAEKEQTP